MDSPPHAGPQPDPPAREESLRREIARLEAELRQARDLIGIAPAFFGFLSPDGIILDVNDLALEVIGSTREKVLGKIFWETAWWSPLPESVRQVREAFAKALERIPSRFDLPYWAIGDGKGEARCVCLELTPLEDVAGTVTRIAATGVDVTDRKAAEASMKQARERLEESERSLRTFIETMPQMAFIADPSGDITYFNQRWYEYIKGLDGTEGWGWKDRPIHLPEDLPRVVARWKESLATGELYEIEYLLRRHDGQYRWHLGRALPLRDVTGKISRWIGTNTDIHDQKRMVQALEDERDIRERFVFTLTHDLRNPLIAARLSAQLMGRNAGNADAVLKFASRIIENVDRADAMIRDLLDVSLIRAGAALPLHVERCELKGLAAETLDELCSLHGNRFILRAPGTIEGTWSPEGIRRILENLCGNAIKYGDRSRPVTVSLLATETEVTIDVHNEGFPIPEEEQKTLFSQFLRTKSAQDGAQRGWGLGLALVKGLAEAHGGIATVRSSAADGTTFRVTLPRSSALAERHAG